MSKKKQPQHNIPTPNLPSADFCEWWNPTGINQPSGAHVGGHPDAERVWARKDPGRWARRKYGINANTAWLCACYRDEYNAWREAGRPKGQPFISIAASLEAQLAFWRGLRSIMKDVGKPMPRTHLEVRNPLRGDAPKALPATDVVDVEFKKLKDKPYHPDWDAVKGTDDDEPIGF